MSINNESNDRQASQSATAGHNALENDRSAASRRAEGAQDSGARSNGSDTRSSRGGRSARGFAAMDPTQQRRIASEGGRAAHQSGHAHEFDSREAREAGRKGGEAVSRNRDHMSAIGRRGAEVRNQDRSTTRGSRSSSGHSASSGSSNSSGMSEDGLSRSSGGFGSASSSRGGSSSRDEGNR